MIDWQWPMIDTLENSGRWRGAKEFMLKKWEEEPEDVKTCVRLAFICWYTLAEWGIPWLDEVDVSDYDECITLLQRLISYGLQHFMEEINFLWTFGYIISLFPEYFGVDHIGHDYLEWELKGKQMLEKAHIMIPEDPIFTMLFLGTLHKRSEDQQERYKQAYRAAKPLLTQRFSGEGAMQVYFGQVLNRDKQI